LTPRLKRRRARGRAREGGQLEHAPVPTRSVLRKPLADELAPVWAWESSGRRPPHAAKWTSHGTTAGNHARDVHRKRPGLLGRRRDFERVLQPHARASHDRDRDPAQAAAAGIQRPSATRSTEQVGRRGLAAEGTGTCQRLSARRWRDRSVAADSDVEPHRARRWRDRGGRTPAYTPAEAEAGLRSLSVVACSADTSPLPRRIGIAFDDGSSRGCRYLAWVSSRLRVRLDRHQASPMSCSRRASSARPGRSSSE
jgi:hypothetical protein